MMGLPYLGTLAGILHVFSLWAATWFRDADPRNTISPLILWAPCVLGSVLFLTAALLLVPVIRGVIAPFWLFFLILELAHCSEVH